MIFFLLFEERHINSQMERGNEMPRAMKEWHIAAEQRKFTILVQRKNLRTSYYSTYLWYLYPYIYTHTPYKKNLILPLAFLTFLFRQYSYFNTRHKRSFWKLRVKSNLINIKPIKKDKGVTRNKNSITTILYIDFV